MKLLDILKEIKVVTRDTVPLFKLEYDPKVDKSYPFFKNTVRVIKDKNDFLWWKNDMINMYGSNILVKKIKNNNKVNWAQGDYKLIVPHYPS